MTHFRTIGGEDRLIESKMDDRNEMAEESREQSSLRDRIAELEKALADADKWIRLAAIDREARAAPHRVIFDFACSECSSDTELVKPGFRCPVHAARHRDALASTPQTQEQPSAHAGEGRGTK